MKDNYTLKTGDLISKTKYPIKTAFGDADTPVNSIEYNSGKAGKGSLFVAIPGAVTDGHQYVRDAVAKGAGAVLISKHRTDEFADLKNKGIVLLTAEDTRKALSGISAAFYEHPSSKLLIIGVTGTKGKTSVTYLIESVLKEAGLNPGVIGTVNYRWNDKIIAAGNTTPESKDIQKIMADMLADEVDVVVMEVSSHALDQNRVDDIDFDMAVFTNLTQDHFDYHKTFENYFNAKKILFRQLEKSPKLNKAGVVNINDEYGKRLLNDDEFTYRMLTFGTDKNADFRIKKDSILTTMHGTSYEFKKPVKEKVILEIIGDFQVYNSAAAYAVCRSIGISDKMIINGFQKLANIPGRFNSIKTNSGFTVVIDYAHTEDSVKKLLESVKELKPGRIITLLGCGGNRDRTKRPLMGHAAVSGSDHVIFTSDNPRDEDPDRIISDIVRDMKETNFEIISDRDKAISKAIYMAGKDDMVVLAGKGHEDYQEIKGRRTHFDDREIALKYINERENN